MSDASIFVGGHAVYIPEFEVEEIDLYPRVRI